MSLSKEQKKQIAQDVLREKALREGAARAFRQGEKFARNLARSGIVLPSTTDPSTTWRQ